jgi:hypothetical protein
MGEGGSSNVSKPSTGNTLAPGGADMKLVSLGKVHDVLQAVIVPRLGWNS